MEFTVKTDEGGYNLEASVKLIGNDLLIAIYGGERPHIGAVAIAQPRPGLKDPEVTKSTVSVFCFLSHKEDEMAKNISEIVSAEFERNVVVTAGVHWDNIKEEGINKVLNNSKILVELINTEIKAII